MADAPERIRIGTDGAVVRSGDAFLNVEGYPVEYVRADLYEEAGANYEAAEVRIAALEQERDRVERDYLDATRVGGEIANENARLREAIREIVDEIEEGAGMVHALKRLRALTQGKNDD
jgi:hypothetical protein